MVDKGSCAGAPGRNVPVRSTDYRPARHQQVRPTAVSSLQKTTDSASEFIN